MEKELFTQTEEKKKPLIFKLKNTILTTNQIVGKNTTIVISFDWNECTIAGENYTYRLSSIKKNENFKPVWINKTECYRWIFTFKTKCDKWLDFYIDEKNNVYELIIR